ncbi:MAG: transcriptional regulator NrdR [Ruminococcus sp.]|nr:transcriptional regulator NrdR [Oscillospiraceae bacterium]
MNCPYCGFSDSKVVDSRPADEKIRRRRECIKCHARFTTYEVVEVPLLMVEKRDGTYEPFNRNKLIQGIFSAIKKRPVTIDMVSEIADYIENYYANELKTIAPSREIGSLVLNKLREIDPVSYIRFASVYKDFTDIKSFVAAISELDDNNGNK